LPLPGQALVESIEPHILQVTPHNLGLGDAPVVVKLLVYNVAVLRQDAIRVSFALKVIDRVENVVFKLDLKEVETALFGSRGVILGEITNKIASIVDNGAKAISKFGNNRVEVNRGEGIIL
jgi:hypothetical protein